MTPLELVGLAFAAFLTVDFVRKLRSGEAWRDFRVLRVFSGWRWLPALAQAVGVMLVVLVVGLVLFVLGGPILRFSWLSLLATTPEEAAGAGQNLAAAGLRIPWFGFIFAALLALNVPRLAMNEELAFRKGLRGWRAHTARSVVFGLVHCLIGIPVAFGLALILAGLWFAFQYGRHGLRHSAAYHCLHNWLVLTLAAFLLLR